MRSFRFLLLWLLGCALCASPTRANQPPQSPREAVKATTPYLAVYTDSQLEDASLHIASPTMIWNGLPFPKPARDLRGDICPLHGNAKDVVPIIYGLGASGGPSGTIYAGCVVGPGSPTRHCNRCDREWGDFSEERASAKKEPS